MPNLREFVQLAKTFTGKENIAAWYMSEKLDGWRALWDGGITRGMPASAVPWANNDKKAHLVRAPKATGLWSRYGNVINAPDWFLDELPDFPLDGELWMGPNSFQAIMSATKRLVPGPEWQMVSYLIFDSPSYREWLEDGEVRNKKNYMKVFKGFFDWASKYIKTKQRTFITGGRNFEETLKLLEHELRAGGIVRLHVQTQLQFNVDGAKKQALDYMEKVVEAGQEGVIVRAPRSYWVPKRMPTMLKIKPENDAEGTVVGYYWGEETELGSKLMGRMGSVIVNWEGKKFCLSGFTDEERLLCTIGDANYDAAWREGMNNPGKLVSDSIQSPRFPRGSSITFTYRELTRDGLPKEARFLRVRPDE